MDNVFTRDLWQIDNHFYFIARGQIYQSDGTTTGTDALTNFQFSALEWETGIDLWQPPRPFEAGGELYFVAFADESQQSRALYKVDDSLRGASVVREFASYNRSGPWYLTESNDKLYFSAPGQGDLRDLWVSDGTHEGTNVVSDSELVGYFNPHGLTQIGAELFFIADDAANQDLFRIDAEGDVTRIQIGSLPRAEFEVNVVPPIGFELGGAPHFAGQDGRIWRVDVGESQATLVAARHPGMADVTVFQSIEAGELLYIAVGRTGTTELWRSDGTAEGTILVESMTSSQSPLQETFQEFDGRLVFIRESLNSSLQSGEICASDGTPGELRVLATGVPFPELYRWPHLGISQGRIFLSLNDPQYGEELFMIPASQPGDANGDDMVNDADYTAWADHFLKPGDWGFAQGDFNRDGVVDAGDYTLWADHFEAGPPELTQPAAAPTPRAPVAAAEQPASSDRETQDARRALSWSAAVEAWHARVPEQFWIDELWEIGGLMRRKASSV